LLSYRHGFHAGNHADVLKHVMLVALLSYLAAKPKGLWYVDTHAGAGIYPLDSGFAARNREHETGIGRLWGIASAPEAIERYLDLIRSLNPDGRLSRYPGSPWLAAHVLRNQDRLWLHELHPADREALTVTFRDRRVTIRGEDGFAGLRALLPPAPRRALVLIDPPYEVKTDYDRVVTSLRDAVQRFPAGAYAVWYPMLAEGRSPVMIEKLKGIGIQDWLDASLTVRTASGQGLYGSGVFVVNPPYTLPGTLETALPFLTDRLGEDDGARHTLQWEIS